MGTVISSISDFLSADKRREDINAFVSNVSASGNNEIPIEQICSVFQLDYLKVTKDLRAMIDSGEYDLFEDAYINLNTKTLILTPHKDTSLSHKLKNMVNDVSSSLLGKKNNEIKNTVYTVNCKCCGANNTVFTGRVNKCEYCDSSIE